MDDYLSRQIREMQERARQSPDGFARSEEEEERINGICRSVLTSPGGKELMNYLRSITVSAVVAPEASDAVLRDREGMRRLFGILENRARSTPKEKEG